MRELRLPVAEQEIEHTVAGDFLGDVGQRVEQLVKRWLRPRKALAQRLHDETEGEFAVGIAHGLVDAREKRREVLQVAVVRKDPMPAPQLPHERMAVFQPHRALRRLADVRDDVLGLDRVALDQFRHRRGAGRLIVDEQAAGLVFEEGDAKAVGMVVGDATARGEPGERERHIGRFGAVHAQQLAHGRGKVGCNKITIILPAAGGAKRLRLHGAAPRCRALRTCRTPSPPDCPHRTSFP